MVGQEIVIVPPAPVDTSALALITDVQFLEPFGSEALNRQHVGIIPAGIYRGFKSSLPGLMKLKIGTAGEIGAARVDVSAELSIAIHQRAPVELVVPAPFAGFVVLEGVYQFGVPTDQVDADSTVKAATIKLVAKADRLSSHVVLYSLNVPAGTSVLTAAMVTTAERQDISIGNGRATETQAGFTRYATQAETNSGIDDTSAVTPKKLVAKLTSAGLTKYGAPLIGSPIDWPLAQMPQNIWPDCGMEFVALNGQPFNKTRYPELAKLYPSGVVPDVRGDFIRAWDNGRGVDAGRELLSWQDSEFEAHAHRPLGVMVTNVNNPGTESNGVTQQYSEWQTRLCGDTTMTGGSETRPRNLAYNKIVRAA
ncbi:MAG: hypothetical protein ACRCT2_06240 [Plesiomonas shigelloides]